MASLSRGISDAKASFGTRPLPPRLPLLSGRAGLLATPSLFHRPALAKAPIQRGDGGHAPQRPRLSRLSKASIGRRAHADNPKSLSTVRCGVARRSASRPKIALFQPALACKPKMVRPSHNPIWPFLVVVGILFLLCIIAPREWERIARACVAHRFGIIGPLHRSDRRPVIRSAERLEFGRR